MSPILHPQALCDITCPPPLTVWCHLFSTLRLCVTSPVLPLWLSDVTYSPLSGSVWHNLSSPSDCLMSPILHPQALCDVTCPPPLTVWCHLFSTLRLCVMSPVLLLWHSDVTYSPLSSSMWRQLSSPSDSLMSPILHSLPLCDVTCPPPPLTLWCHLFSTLFLYVKSPVLPLWHSDVTYSSLSSSMWRPAVDVTASTKWLKRVVCHKCSGFWITKWIMDWCVLYLILNSSSLQWYYSCIM